MDKQFFNGRYYVDANYQKLPRSAIIANYMQGGRNTTSVITPRALAAAREQLGCGRLRGAELEEDGGQGTAGSHWCPAQPVGDRSAMPFCIKVCMRHEDLP
jgi:Leishmanolysin